MVWATSSILYMGLVAVLLLGHCGAAAQTKSGGGGNQKAARTFAETSFRKAHTYCDARRDDFVTKYLTGINNNSASGVTVFYDYWLSEPHQNGISRWATCGTTKRNTLHEVSEILCDIENSYIVKCDDSKTDVYTFTDIATKFSFNASAYTVSVEARPFDDKTPCACPPTKTKVPLPAIKDKPETPPLH